MSDEDALVALRQQLAELDEAPLSSHPEVLERAHRALVGELEALEHVEVPEAGESAPGAEDAAEAAPDPGERRGSADS